MGKTVTSVNVDEEVLHDVQEYVEQTGYKSVSAFTEKLYRGFLDSKTDFETEVDGLTLEDIENTERQLENVNKAITNLKESFVSSQMNE